MRSQLKALALIMIVNLTLAVPGAWAGPPTDVVKNTIEEVIRLLRDPALKSPSQKRHRRQLMKKAVDRNFDYTEMAKRSLGSFWRTLSPGQQKDFVRLFADLLQTSYADKVEHYSDEKVDYQRETIDGDHAEVRTVLLRKNDRIPMNYSLLQEPGGWKVYDVVIEGVSLVNNYRSQFSRVIRESSYAELVKRLRTKVSELQKMEKL